MADWKRICDNPVQDFIIKNELADERQLVLQHKTLFDLPTKSIAEQIAGRRKSKKKLPLWYETKGIVYPPTLNLEQSSSQATALFKATLLKTETGQENLIDLTGGFGVDSFFFSKQFDSVKYVEPNAELLKLVQHNHAQLGARNIIYIEATAEEVVSQIKEAAVFFIDPARRDANAKKNFKLSDCTPDITQLQKQLFTQCEFVLVKASPLLDIQQGLRELPHTKTVIALSVENEMKELLFLVQRDFTGTPEIIAIDLDSKGEIKSKFAFAQAQEAAAQPAYSEPLHYLYEPGAAILKAGAFKLIAQHFSLHKLAPNTHLYTSNTHLKYFPGRTFRIEHINPTEKQLRQLLPDKRAHIAVRNYPLTARQLMKKLNLQEGGNKFVWGFSEIKKKYIALCSRLQGAGKQID
ncbi:MAG: SAM-dependent methyltransferase [Cyclobacteriaceae bacterium]|nr:SAM-dependent methyltransferase [Cyclobacteriaceae bacterium]